MQTSPRVAVARFTQLRHIANLVAATFVTIAIASLTAWVLLNWIVGCGEINPQTGYVNTEVCIMHPTNWRN